MTDDTQHNAAENTPSGGGRAPMLVLRLYIAGSAPNSQRALQNLQALFDKHLGHPYQLEVVDVLEEPLRALSDDVLLTPTLRKLSPPPAAQIIGDLSDSLGVLSALGIPERHDG